MAGFNSTTNPNPLKQYASLTNESIVGFKAGSQTALNALISSGSAIEGVFYLTEDTHKLYIGRRNPTTNKVIPEQVSRGVTVVESVSDLDFPVVAPEGAIEEGELFYVTNDNILAALRYNNSQNRYEWVQINPPTGISSFDITPSKVSNDIVIREIIGAENGNTTATWVLKKGDNITLASTTATVDGTTVNAVIVSATNTTYAAAVATSTTQGEIGLKENDGTSITGTSIKFVGNNGTLVSSNSANSTVTISSITLNGVNITPLPAGYSIGISGFEGDNNTELNIPSTTFNPVIQYGKSGSTTSAVFNNGIASLDVYSITQTNAAIDEAINAKLKAADAMTFVGVVSSFAELRTKIINNGGAHNGDVFKVSSDNFVINGISCKTGDLIILNGEEDTTDKVIKINGSTVSASTSAEQLYSICEIIPSGDEPVYQGSITQSSTSTVASSFSIYDANNSNNKLIDIAIQSGTLINVTSLGDTSNNLNITLAHATVARTSTTNSSVTTTANVTISDDTYKFFALAPSSSSGYGIKTDNYGHVTNLYGKIINLKHNRLSDLALTYIASGGVQLTVQDSLTSVSNIISFTSNNLHIYGDVNNNAIGINLNWGTF